MTLVAIQIVWNPGNKRSCEQKIGRVLERFVAINPVHRAPILCSVRGATNEIVTSCVCGLWQFVAEVLPGKHGWVLRSVEGGDHMLADSHGGKAHALIHSLSAVMESGRLRKGTSRLRQAEYFKTGMRMKMAGNTCAMIHETLRIVAQEEGRDVLWNLADIKEVFGLDSKKRVANADKSTMDDKYDRCLVQCRDMCAKVKGNEEDCEFLFHHLSKFDRQLTLHRRKRKASVALDTHSPNGEDLADADKIASPQIMGIIGFQPPVPMQQQQQPQQQQVQM